MGRIYRLFPGETQSDAEEGTLAMGLRAELRACDENRHRG